MDATKLLQTAIALGPKIQSINNGLMLAQVGRGDMVHATWLSFLTGRPAFFLGVPGVAKTATVKAMCRRVEGMTFHEELMPAVASPEQLLVESTVLEETELPGGGKSVRAHSTLGGAAKSHVFFADEIWKTQPMVLQATLDLSLGAEVRLEGSWHKTPMLSFLAASNELPEPEGNLGAAWSRMTIRVVVESLDRAGKVALVKARSARDQGKASAVLTMTLEELMAMRQARPFVTVSDEIVDTVLEILYEKLGEEFEWARGDDRRFGRIFDVLQAEALLAGRTIVTKADLRVLEWLLWDEPGQISAVRAAVHPYCRTAVGEARELIDALLAPGGAVAVAFAGNDSTKLTDSLRQCNELKQELSRMAGEASGTEADTIGRWQAGLAEFSTKLAMKVAGVDVSETFDQLTAVFNR